MLLPRLSRMVVASLVVPLLAGIPNREMRAAPPVDPITEAGKQDLATNLLVGNVAAAEGDNSEAARAYGVAAGLAPTFRLFGERAFFYSILAGSPEAAALAHAQPPGVMPALIMGNAAALAGRWDEAVTHYQNAPADQIMGLLRPLLRAWALQGAGKTDEALAALAPAEVDARLGGYYTLHSALIAQLGGMQMRADTLFRQAAEKGSGDLFTTVVMARWLVTQGQEAAARDLINQRITAMPVLETARANLMAMLQHPVVSHATQGLAQAYGLVALLIDQQLYAHEGADEDHAGDAAMEIGTLRGTEQMMLRMALTLDPADSEARLLLSSMLHARKQDRQARAAFDGAPASDPLLPVYRAEQADLDVVLGHKEQAAQELRDLLRQAPDDRTLWSSLGDALLDQQKWPEALDAYQHATALAPHRLEGDDWRLLFGQAIAQERQNHWPQARVLLQHALQLAPNEAELLNYLGYSMVEHGENPALAESYLRRALALAPSDNQIRDSVGWVLMRLGHVAEGLPLLEQSVEQMPQDPAINYHLGVAYWMAGRRLEAVNEWQNAIAFQPDPMDRRKITAALDYAHAWQAHRSMALPADLKPVATPPSSPSQPNGTRH
ncbi:tetratricopeptide repeat protein [Komagataeibacter melomenusus]|nr:tetratricopeptide repeat protein [Komagataeibacter melomenusus]